MLLFNVSVKVISQFFFLLFSLWSELGLFILGLSAQCFGRDVVSGLITRTFPSCLKNNVIVFAGRSVDE